MKRQVLVCDACPQNGQVVLAKDRLRIVGLTEKPLAMDLCDDHLTALKASIDLNFGKQTREAPAPSNKKLRFTDQVAQFVAEQKRPVTTSEVIEFFDGVKDERAVQSTLANLHNNKNSPVKRVARATY